MKPNRTVYVLVASDRFNSPARDSNVYRVEPNHNPSTCDNTAIRPVVVAPVENETVPIDLSDTAAPDCNTAPPDAVLLPHEIVVAK